MNTRRGAYVNLNELTSVFPMWSTVLDCPNPSTATHQINLFVALCKFDSDKSAHSANAQQNGIPWGHLAIIYLLTNAFAQRFATSPFSAQDKAANKWRTMACEREMQVEGD